MSFVELPVLDRPARLRHSFSRISTFSDICELRYALDAVMPRQPASDAMLRGTHVHDIAEKAANEIIDGAEIAVALETAAHFVEGPLGEEQLAPYLALLTTFFERVEPGRGGVEFWVRDLEWDGQRASDLLELPWCGKVDLVGKPSDADWTVFDYKTIARWSKVKSEYEARRSLQLRSYCLSTGQNRAGFVWLNPNFELKTTEVEFTDEELAEGFNQLVHFCRTAEHRWKHGGWNIASDNFLCSEKWCDWYKRGCRGCAEDVQGVIDSADDS